MGTEYVYDVASALKGGQKRKATDEVEVALAPEELANLDEETLKAKYEQQRREASDSTRGEDMSDLVAEHANKQAKKRQKKDTSSSKKGKEFKF
jgi:splicing factor 3B subunit 2